MVLVGAGIGLAFLLIAWAVFRQYGIEQLNRGFIFTLAVGGLLLLSGLGYASQLSKKIEAVSSYSQTSQELQQAETQRVEKILAGSYKLSFIIATVLLVAGVVLLLMYPNNLFRGIGLALLIFGTTVHSIDFFSMNNHKIYLETIKGLRF